MQVLDSYKRALAKLRRVPFDRQANAILTSYRERRVNTSVEFLNGVASPYSSKPHERELTPCKFYFDYDEVVLPSDIPSDIELAEKKLELCEDVRSILVKGAGIESVGEDQILVACRHGVVTDGKFKISFRLFVTGFSTDPISIKNAIINAECLFGFRNRFDMSVYSKSRRLCMILCQKTLQDSRILRPSDQTVQVPSDLFPYIVQHIDKSWPSIKVSILSKFQRLNTARPDDMVEEMESDEDGEACEENRGSSKRQKGQTITSSQMFGLCRDVLHEAGFTNPMQISDAREAPDIKNVYIDFDCDARGDCPICHNCHDNNHWYLHVSKMNGISVASHSERCKKIDLMGTHFLHGFVDSLLKDETAHQHYNQLFIKSRPGTLLYNPLTSMFHEFNDHIWKEVADEYVIEEIRIYVGAAVLDKQIHIIESWKATLFALKMSNETMMERVNYILKQVIKARNNVGSTPFLSYLVKMLKHMCYTSPDIFDKNYDLVHFDNGVFDLENMTFRDAKPDDYNTLSVGYDYESDVSESQRAMHRNFINSIYPDPGHREVAQRVMGSTLTGNTSGKKFYIFTDNGGEFGGNNGKTMIFTLHARALGSYALNAKKDFLYDGHTSAEGASPFLMKLAGKRVLVCEELEPSKKLAEGTVKELTNGINPVITARNLYKSSQTIELCAKIMVGCNHGKFPRFDPYDTALTNRFLPVPHISHFTTDASKLDAIRHIYPVDMNMNNKLRECIMAHFEWCLEGYRNFQKFGLGLDSMPQSITEFKRIFVFKNTPVFTYLGEVMEDTGDIRKDILDMNVVWDMYKKDKRSNKYLTMEQFESTFKVFANTYVQNSFQYIRTANGRTSGAVARGYKVKAQMMGYENSVSHRQNNDELVFL